MAGYYMSFRDWTQLGILSVLWGGSFFLVELVVSALPALVIVALRVGMGAVILWAVAGFLKLKIPVDTHSLIAFAVMGLLNNIAPFLLFVSAQSELAGGVAAILNATTPIFTVLVAHIFTENEKATRTKLLAVAIGFLGVVLVVLERGLELSLDRSVAYLACLAAAASYAFAGIFGRRFAARGIAPVAAAIGQLSASSVILVPLALVLFPTSLVFTLTPLNWFGLIGLGVFSTALAYLLYFDLLSRAGATNLLLVTFLIPISAILLGVAFIGETITSLQILGMVVIGLALMIIDGRVLKRVLSRLSGSQH